MSNKSYFHLRYRVPRFALLLCSRCKLFFKLWPSQLRFLPHRDFPRMFWEAAHVCTLFSLMSNFFAAVQLDFSSCTCSTTVSLNEALQSLFAAITTVLVFCTSMKLCRNVWHIWQQGFAHVLTSLSTQTQPLYASQAAFSCISQVAYRKCEKNL